MGCSRKLSPREACICTRCRHQLPFTLYHKHHENPVTNAFYGRVIIENATALLHYKKNSMVQQLLHQLKYKGQQEIGTILGNILGNNLKEEADFKKISL